MDDARTYQLDSGEIIMTSWSPWQPLVHAASTYKRPSRCRFYTPSSTASAKGRLPCFVLQEVFHSPCPNASTTAFTLDLRLGENKYSSALLFVFNINFIEQWHFWQLFKWFDTIAKVLIILGWLATCLLIIFVIAYGLC